MIFSFGTRFIQRLWIASLAVILISLVAKSAYACTSFPPTPWFNENVNLLKTNLPDRILIEQNGRTVTLTNNLNTSSFYFYMYNGLQELGKSVQYSSYNNAFSVNGYYGKALDPRNTEEDNRPADVKPPKPQETSVELFLDRKSYDLQFRISYELNNDYMPNRLRASDSSCEDVSLFYFGFNDPGPLFFIAILMLVVLTLIFIVLLKKFKSLGK